MKSNNEFRLGGVDTDSDEVAKKVVKLAPIKKSGKEKHAMYSNLEEEDEDYELGSYKKRESILDYYDDVEEDELESEESQDEEEYDEEQDEDYDDEEEYEGDEDDEDEDEDEEDEGEEKE